MGACRPWCDAALSIAAAAGEAAEGDAARGGARGTCGAVDGKSAAPSGSADSKREGVRYHKRVRFYLFRYVSGDVSDHDDEVLEARWVDLEEAEAMLSFDNEKRVLSLAAAVIARATVLARADMKRRGVAMVAGFGGYPSFSPALAARILGLPILHEQGSRLSMANRQLLRFASRVATSFPDIAGVDQAARGRLVQTGNPVRAEILEAARAPYPPLAGSAPLRLLVVGGSQGAAVFGRVVPQALRALPAALRSRIRLSLQYRGDDAATVASTLADAGIHVELRPFFDDMAARLRDARNADNPIPRRVVTRNWQVERQTRQLDETHADQCDAA